MFTPPIDLHPSLLFVGKAEEYQSEDTYRTPL
jgi:hypothetical protein